MSRHNVLGSQNAELTPPVAKGRVSTVFSAQWLLEKPLDASAQQRNSQKHDRCCRGLRFVR